jgi:hypothetical protein
MIKIILCLTLTGCSFAHYTRTNEGTVDVYGYSIGTSKALDGLEYRSDGKGVIKLNLSGYDSDQTKALEAIVSGAVQGAAKAVKP